MSKEGSDETGWSGSTEFEAYGEMIDCYVEGERRTFGRRESGDVM